LTITIGNGGVGTGATGVNLGGPGGILVFTSGAGGNATGGAAGLAVGGQGGATRITSGNGGDGGNGTGGQGGAFQVSAGSGGAVTSGTHAGGVGGLFSFIAGNGGNATAGATNGAGGNVTIDAGNPGTGAGTVNIKGRTRIGFLNNTTSSMFTAVCGADAAPTTGGNVHLVPSYTPTVGAAGNVDVGFHSYKITYLSIFGETLPSFASAQVNPGVASQISVPLPLGPPGTTGRNIYRRKVPDTGAYFLISASPMVNDNTTATYTDNTADASLTATTPPVVDTSKINPSVLEVQSTQEAFLLPRMTTAQRDAMLALDGMMIYNLSVGVAAAQVHQNGVWVSF